MSGDSNHPVYTDGTTIVGDGTVRFPLSAGGGGGSNLTLFNYPPAMGGAPTNVSWTGSSNAGQVANGIALWRFTLPYPIAVSKLWLQITTDDEAHLNDFGIYSLTGELLANVGPTSISATGLTDLPLLQGTVDLPAGDYFFAWTMNVAGGVTIDGGSLAGIEYFFYARTPSGTPMWPTTATVSTGGTLPATIVPPTMTAAANLTNATSAGGNAVPAFALSGA
jgi:hypothetical protein